MNIQATSWKDGPITFYQEAAPTYVSPRMTYLCPSRYFHFYVLYDRKTRQTCWLPEGYGQ